MHDKFVNRTTNGTGMVSEKTWDELQLLDAGNGERVPCVEEALAAINGHAGAILEAKMPGIGSSHSPSCACVGFLRPGNLCVISARGDS